MAERDEIAALLGQSPDVVVPCAKGGNNRALRVEAGGKPYLAKYYFKSAEDTRPRMQNEWAFLSYAAQSDVPAVPRPLAKNDKDGLAIYSFLPGVVPNAQQIDADAVAQAGALIANLNQKRERARELADASESCFSAGDHLALLEARIRRLDKHDALPEHAAALAEVVRDIQATFARYAPQLDYAPLAATERCLSPSDFGFHNSLRDEQGRFSFIDFEYAGWDDPAKMLCDFLLHPGVSVETGLLSHLLKPLEKSGIVSKPVLTRTRMLYPLLALRWCCIILNVFVPEHAARRQFSDSAWDKQAAQAAQLAKARHMLHKIPANPF